MLVKPTKPVMHRTKQIPKVEKATTLNQEDKNNLKEFIRDNRSTLKELSKL
jgi:hypothetical protein